MKQLHTPLILLLNLLLLSACHTTRHTTDSTDTLQTTTDSTHTCTIHTTQSRDTTHLSHSIQQNIAITTYHLSPPDSTGQQHTTQIQHINLTTTSQTQHKQTHHTQTNLEEQTTRLSEAVIIGQKATTTQSRDNTSSLRTLITIIIIIILALTMCSALVRS